MRCPVCGSKTYVLSCGSCRTPKPEFMNELVRKVVASSRGNVETSMLVSEEGSVLAHNPVASYDEYVAAAAAALGAAAKALIQAIQGNIQIRRIDLRMADDSVVVVIPTGEAYLAVKTKPRPNLGMVNIVLSQLDLA